MNPLMTESIDTHVSSPVIVALDFAAEAQALNFVSQLNPNECQLKVGKELFTASGRSLIESLVGRGFRVFLDLKFHDIPNTVAHACKVAAEMGVWMVDVHASGGRRMMEAAREAIEVYSQRPLLIGVTVLTSMDIQDLQELGIQHSPAEQVQHLAKLAQKSGLDGVVCSAQEAALLKSQLGGQFKLVTPGIRPQQATQDDQRRVMTPVEALQAGSDYLVIGRPITQATSPLDALRAINQDIQLYQQSKS